GFGEYPGIASTMRVTFDAVSVLNLIGRAPRNRTAVVGYVTGLRNPDGGFGEEGESNVESTFRAVMTLQLLGEPIEDMASTVAYLRSCQNHDGGFGFAAGYVSRCAYTYRALRALQVLGSRALNDEGARTYLASLQNPDGGFGNFADDGSSELGSTYRAVHGLHILGDAPPRPNAIEGFVLGAWNPDGGFRRSPVNTTAPGNFSRSYYTYDAVFALHYLGRPLEGNATLIAYLESLRNPDLGFATNPFFTSAVSSTFTALWALFRVEPLLNAPPVLTDGAVESPMNATGTAAFSIDVDDPVGQVPESVHLVLDSARYMMSMQERNGTSMTFGLSLELTVGEHDFHFTASDGLSTSSTGDLTVTVAPAYGNPPAITLFVNDIEGTSETLFAFTAAYEDADHDPPAYVRLNLAEEVDLEMDPVGGGMYVLATTLPPGSIEGMAVTSDGMNLVSSNVITVLVHPINASRPDWDTFVSIRGTVRDAGYGEIAYLDVTLASHGGHLAWRVETDEVDVMVSYDGERILDGSKGDDAPSLGSIMTALALALTAIAAGSLIIKGIDRSHIGKERKEGRGKGGDE
ncbi:MAG: terpene cyclase/mutase family protein, partial [Thermoplasmata archaeon]|nr:terpene cyclase/mutase family protein [Thermoplasmata archaeon]